jgi:transposase
MTTENQARRKQTEEFKREAVALVTEQGYKLSEAARSVDVNVNFLSKSRDRFAEEAAGTRLTGDKRDELKQLRKENKLLKMEKEILKKASQYFAKEMRSTARTQGIE